MNHIKCVHNSQYCVYYYVDEIMFLLNILFLLKISLYKYILEHKTQQHNTLKKKVV